ncbi:MAG: DUF483 domain-containing protein [Candidatus Woesearchaeota archaeon]
MSSLEDRILELDFIGNQAKLMLALVSSRRKNSGGLGFLENETGNADEIKEFCKGEKLDIYSYFTDNQLIRSSDGSEQRYKHIFLWHEKSVLDNNFKSFLNAGRPRQGNKKVKDFREELEEYNYKCGIMYGYPECCSKRFSEIYLFTKEVPTFLFEVLRLHEKRKPIDDLIATLYVPCSVNCEKTLDAGNGKFLKRDFPRIFRSYKRNLLKQIRKYRDNVVVNYS